MSEELQKYEGGLGRMTRKPREVIEEATEGAKWLRDVIDKRGLAKKIGDGEHVEVEGWTTAASFYGFLPTVPDEPQPLCDNDGAAIKTEDGRIYGWKAKGSLVHMDTGRSIQAFAICARDEENWKEKSDKDLMSMAQTRAISKVCRLAFSRVIVLAGYQPTPAEEMDHAKPFPVSHGSVEMETQSLPKCPVCGGPLKKVQSKFKKGEFWYPCTRKGCKGKLTQQQVEEAENTALAHTAPSPQKDPDERITEEEVKVVWAAVRSKNIPEQTFKEYLQSHGVQETRRLRSVVYQETLDWISKWSPQQEG